MHRSPPSEPPPSPPTPPLSVVTEQGVETCLCHTANPHVLALLHVVCVCFHAILREREFLDSGHLK